jgi:hypothetical protein
MIHRATIFAMATVASIAIQKPPMDLRVSAYVTVLPLPVSPEGFVDGNNQFVLDSLKDLKSALSKEYYDVKPKGRFPVIGPAMVPDKSRKVRFVLVNEPAEADISLTVVARGDSMSSFGQRTTMRVYSGVAIADTEPTAAITRWVSMLLEVGTYRKEFVTWSTNGSVWSLGAWKADASLLAKNVADWLIANETEIRRRQNR